MIHSLDTYGFWHHHPLGPDNVLQSHQPGCPGCEQREDYHVRPRAAVVEVPVDPHDPVYGLGSLPDDPWFGSDEFVDGDPFDRPVVTAGLVDVPDDEDVVDDDVCHPHGINRPNYQIRTHEVRIGSFVYTKTIKVIVSNRPRRAK